MNNKQKILLCGSIIAYILFLVFFIRTDLPLMLVFFIIQSVLLIAFSYLCWRSASEPKEELDQLRAENVLLKEQNEKILDEAHVRTSEKDNALKAAKEELVDARNQVTELERQVSSLTEELNSVRMEAMAREAEAAEEDDGTSFLPQIRKQPAATINIIEVAKNAAAEMAEAAQKAGLTIRIASNKDTYLVKANPEMLRIMFRNIMDNSIKYMNRHGVLIVTISNIEEDLFVVLKDNGEGLAESETKHIFELNYQGSNRISGNGLGLTQAKAIINYYGGTVYAKSTPGKGMGIYIQLPTT
ncbi:MAG: hypothetical protein IJT05_06010 [Lachnospiraceae bacterium]|nr:hypothetical protein [Lachnospiraceae bacterium]